MGPSASRDAQGWEKKLGCGKAQAAAWTSHTLAWALGPWPGPVRPSTGPSLGAVGVCPTLLTHPYGDQAGPRLAMPWEQTVRSVAVHGQGTGAASSLHLGRPLLESHLIPCHSEQQRPSL